MNINKNDYWEKRGKGFFYFKKERFYTVTPIGLYYNRRKVIIKKIDKEIKKLDNAKKVLDFGCGDGYYTRLFSKNYPEISFHGTDISESMIEVAVENSTANNCKFEVQKGNNIPFKKVFDLIFIVAVFAHILNHDLLKKIANNLSDKLNVGGKLILIEATISKDPITGVTWQRLNPEFYIELFTKTGIELESKELISFPLFYKCGMNILSKIVFIFFKNDFLRANKNKLYQYLSIFLIGLSNLFNPFMKSGVGNSVFIYKKK